MTPNDPQFLYMILVLPSLFGLTLMGEGIYKCAHEEWSGLISVFLECYLLQWLSLPTFSSLHI